MMDKLELAAPKSIADLKAIAKAFVEKDPGGNGSGKTIGISGPQNGVKLSARPEHGTAADMRASGAERELGGPQMEA